MDPNLCTSSCNALLSCSILTSNSVTGPAAPKAPTSNSTPASASAGTPHVTRSLARLDPPGSKR